MYWVNILSKMAEGMKGCWVKEILKTSIHVYINKNYYVLPGSYSAPSPSK
jgi:hypothetical protein